MRGKAMIFGRGSIVAGITPAYAGKRTIDIVNPVEYADHPRVCGEKGCMSK